MILQNGYCRKCGEQYLDKSCAEIEWCKSCQMHDLESNFLNWSEDEKIDNFVQEMQLKIGFRCNSVFEWIPYSQFNDIKKIGKGGVYTATWKDGPLYNKDDEKKWKRNSDVEVVFKCLYNSRNSDEFLNEVR